MPGLQRYGAGAEVPVELSRVPIWSANWAREADWLGHER